MNPEYQSQLRTIQWAMRSEQIKARDGYICERCGANHFKKRMETHHRYYIFGADAWDYPDEALTTLCIDCHRKAHLLERIPIVHSDGSPVIVSFKCERCGGPGEIPEYRHVQNGVCFRCWGSGIDTAKLFKKAKVEGTYKSFTKKS